MRIHSPMLFAHLTREEVELVADTYGSPPYFANLPVAWHQGDRIKSIHQVFEAFIKTSFKAVCMVALHVFYPSRHVLAIGRPVR